MAGKIGKLINFGQHIMGMAATGAVGECEKLLLTLERESDSVLDLFISNAEAGREFYPSMEKIEEQLRRAEKLESSQSELELNEATVLADKMEHEMFAVEKLACGAVLSETQEEWAEQFEGLRMSLQRMGVRVRKAKALGANKKETASARGMMLSFNNDAFSCKVRLAKLKIMLANRKHPHFSKVRSVKARVRLLKGSIGRIFTRMSKTRLKKKSDEAKASILEFISRAGRGRIAIDRKHLTLRSGSQKMRMSLTQPVWFGLEEIAPIGDSLSKLGENTLLFGSFEKEGDALLLKIGERTVDGDSIVYREKTFRV